MAEIDIMYWIADMTLNQLRERQSTSSMSDTDTQNENNASDKQVDVKDKFVETDPDEFCTKTCTADLTLIIEDRSLQVNRSLLAYASPVFDTMFSRDFREKDQQTITLQGKKFNDFVEFMRCMNPHVSKPVTLDNVYDVLPLAHEYQVKHLLKFCEITLSENASDRLYHVLKIASMYNLKELTAKCVKLAAERPPGELEEIGKTNELDTNTINAVRSQMLTNLTTKHKDIFVHITTSEALYRVLGIQSKQQNLVAAFKNGKVFGDFRKLQLTTAFSKSVDMCIDGNIYSIVIDRPWTNAIGMVYDSNKFISLTIECKSVRDPTAQYVSGIYIKNWMDQNEDMYQEKVLASNSDLMILDKDVNVLSDKSNGYMKEGMLFDVELFLFIVNK